MTRRAPPSPPDEPPDDLAALYRAPLADFIDARNALAARLRKAGDAEAAARVKALPKPSAPAWALNQVYWRARADFDRMIASGDQLRGLQQQMLSGRQTDPRDAMQARQASVRTVVDRAAAFLAEAGQPATDTARQRINVTADALATWGSQPHGYTPGRLDRELEPPGFAALASLGGPALRLVKSGRQALAAGTQPAPPAEGPTTSRRDAPHPPPRPKAEPPPSRLTKSDTAAAKRSAARAAQENGRAREAERKRLRQAVHETDREARTRAAARERAAAALARARAERETAADEVAALERQLAGLRAKLDRAEGVQAAAAAAAEDAERAHRQAEEAATRARQAMENGPDD